MSLSKTYSRKIHNAWRGQQLPLVNPGVHGHDSTLLRRYVPVDIDPTEVLPGFCVSFPSCDRVHVRTWFVHRRYLSCLFIRNSCQAISHSASQLAYLPACLSGPPTSVFKQLEISKAFSCFHMNYQFDLFYHRRT